MAMPTLMGWKTFLWPLWRQRRKVWLPLERILLETDCPVEHQRRTTRPRDVFITLREVSRLKGLPLEEVAERTTQNMIDLFGPVQ